MAAVPVRRGPGRAYSSPPAMRPVLPDAILTQEEARVAALRARAASSVSTLRGDLEALEQALAGRVSSVAPAVAGRPSRLSMYTSLLSQATSVQGVSSDDAVSAILANFAKYGLRERSFDTVVPVTAPNEIDDVGNFYDAGAVYDAWILNPSVDTKFDFNQLPSQNTPFISANSRMQFEVRKQKVWYLAENPGTTGVLQIWLLKFAGT